MSKLPYTRRYNWLIRRRNMEFLLDNIWRPATEYLPGYKNHLC
jgi:hypothetical protein